MHVIAFEFCMCKGHTNSILKAEQTSVPVLTPGPEFNFPGKTIHTVLNYCAFFGERFSVLPRAPFCSLCVARARPSFSYLKFLQVV